MSNRASHLCTAAILVLLTAGSAAAVEPTAIHFTADQRVDGLSGVPDTSIAIEGWAATGVSRIEMPDGIFVLAQDGGKNLSFCDSKVKSYWRVEPQALLRDVSAAFDIREPKLEKLLDEPGGPILGQPTRHTRYRISYRAVSNLPGQRPMDITIERKTWSAPGLPVAGIDSWLVTGDFPSGQPELEKLLAAMRETVKGLPLRMKISNTTTLKEPDGKTETSQTDHVEVVVKSLETVSVDPSRFAVPEGYKEIAAPKMPGAGD